MQNVEHVVDNIRIFRHVVYPKEIITDPKIVIVIENKETKAKYFFGCAICPLKQELEEVYLPNDLWLMEKFDIFDFDLKKQYSYQIIKRRA